MQRTILVAAAALVAGGCATTDYQLAVMPRDSGKIYPGFAQNVTGSEGPITISIEGKEYRGTWVQTVPSYTTGYTTGFGWGWGRGWGYPWGAVGGSISMDNPQGGEAKALLTAADGSGLRCDFRGGPSVRGGGGVCRDDKGMTYDVQMRPAPAPAS